MRTITPVLVALAALTLAACGGSSSSSSSHPSGPKLEKAALGAQAKIICAASDKAGNALTQPDLNDPTKAAAYFDAIAVIGKTQATALGKLNPADDVKDDWNAFIAENDKVLSSIGDLEKAAKAKDRKKGVSLLKAFQGEQGAYTSAAKKVGADSCAN